MASRLTRIEAPAPRRITVLALAVAVLLGAALTALTWGYPGTFPVDVDGKTVTVPSGTTIGSLVSQGLTHGRAGRMYSVHGKILRLFGGQPVQLLRNGRPANERDRVFASDRITSISGADRTEHVVTVRIPIEPAVTVTGVGPILKLMRAGKSGTQVVRKGSLSGEVVSHYVLTPPTDVVLAATMPAANAKMVALTFDDGPWPGSTLKIVQILKDAGVRATFFELGQQVRRDPKTSRAVIEAGNVIGNHSWSHPFLTKLKPAQIRKQITDSAGAIKWATGQSPKVFRPPYGAIDRDVWNQARITRETVTLWDVDALDWTRPGADKIVRNVTSHMGRVSIVLMHDGGGDRSQTIRALPRIIAWLKANGYVFVTVPELQSVR